MKQLLLLIFLLIAFGPCSAQDQYLQVTSDSTLAFKLAMSNPSLLGAVPRSPSWPASYHLEKAGWNMTGSVITGVISSLLIARSVIVNLDKQEFQATMMIAGIFSLSSVIMRILAAHHLIKAGSVLAGG